MRTGAIHNLDIAVTSTTYIYIYTHTHSQIMNYNIDSYR